MTTEEISDLCAAQAGEHWRLWFAWHPVWLDQEHRFTWLRTVWRRDFEIGWGCSVHQRRLRAPTPSSEIARLGGEA